MIFFQVKPRNLIGDLARLQQDLVVGMGEVYGAAVHR